MKELMEGSHAIAEAGVVAGCKFFAGYPMTPFTEVLEHFAVRLPEVGGVCINAESELEAIGMAWGACSTGRRAATGSTGQGLSLMQESFSEATMAGLPLVLFNIARGQYDYYQATRGGGHGDYRMVVLAPMDVTEAVDHCQLAFHIAETWRNPVLFMGDYLLTHTYEAVDVQPIDFGPVPDKPWAVDGSTSGTGHSKLVTSLGFDATAPGGRKHDPEAHWNKLAEKWRAMGRAEVRSESGYTEDAEVVVVAFGTLAKFVRYVCKELRAEGYKVGYVRPITLWPFPEEAVAAAASNPAIRVVAVLENNAGQMIDDVRLSVLGRCPVTSIGGISTDGSGFGMGSILDPLEVRSRILSAFEREGALA
jgi:2-oxoglutarate/2-oxoacid ferredoxin oxidoreductase subunit alpha